MSRSSFPIQAGFALAIVFAVPAAEAVVYLVGGDTACTHATVQSAIDALPPGGNHEIRVNTGIFAAQAIKIDSRDLMLRGGYADCGAGGPSGSTTLSGQGGAPDSVIAITGHANYVLLENLSIIRGDEAYTGLGDEGYGGGIDFRGSGMLTLHATAVSQNVADYGGGIRIDGNARLIALQDRIGIYNNSAVEGSGDEGGYGGGVLVVGPARADIGSPGLGNSGPIAFNRARYGGGIAAVAPDDELDVLVRLFTTDAQRPIRLHDNRALQTGGAIYVRPNRGFASSATATVYVFDYVIEDNIAQNGSAIYDDTESDTVAMDSIGGIVYLEPRINNTRPIEFGAVPCVAGLSCRLIEDNLSETDTGVATNGATLLAQSSSSLYIKETPLKINRSILWQPGKALLQDLGGDNELAYLLVSDVASLGGPNASFVQFDPRFVEPEAGDYRLRAASVGVDFAPVPVADEPPYYVFPPSDLGDDPRVSDIRAIPDFLGPVDVGAFERPDLQPLAINGDFDLDVRLWQDLRPGDSSHDGTQNAMGAPGSGALRIDIDNPTLATFAVRQQCVHLPVPGRYTLNASGRAGGTFAAPSSVLLGWELRHDGGHACTDGAPNLSGEHLLATLFPGPGGGGWKRPAMPAEIQIAPEDWTINSSINIVLAVHANVVPSDEASGWIDGVRLELDGDEPPSGLPFADGFED